MVNHHLLLPGRSLLRNRTVENDGVNRPVAQNPNLSGRRYGGAQCVDRRTQLSFLVVLFAVVTPILSAPSPVSAALIRSLELPELCDLADWVVVGTILDVGRPVEAAGGRIMTEFPVMILEPLKGDAAFGEVVPIRQPGGRLSGVVMTTPKTTVVRPGDQVVLFLRKVETGFVFAAMDRSIWRLEQAAGEQFLAQYAGHHAAASLPPTIDGRDRRLVSLQTVRQLIRGSEVKKKERIHFNAGSGQIQQRQELVHPTGGKQ